MLLIDAANVIGARPNGWWRDRAGAARRFVDDLRDASLDGPVVVVLEGQARRGAEPGSAAGVEVVHAPAEGDDTLQRLAAHAAEPVTLVSADRGLATRVRAVGGAVVGPRWLLDRLIPDEVTSRHRAAVEAGEPGYLDPDTGLFVFTSAYHLERGSCCGSGCRHCPYND